MRPRSIAGTERVAIDRGWECAASPANAIGEPAAAGALAWIPASVPGTAAGALRDAKQWHWDAPRDFDGEDWWWRAKLPAVGDGAVVLGFDGVATLWTAWIDGHEVARGDSMFAAQEIALPATRAGAELVIRCRALAPELAIKRARPRWRVPMLEQQQLRWIRTTLLGRTPGWSPPCPAVGPWRGVWLERRGPIVVRRADVRALVDGEVAVELDADGLDDAELVVVRGDQRAHARVERDGRARVKVAGPALWWPHTHGEPARYRVTIERGGEPLVDLGHVGFRRVDVDQTDGRFAIHVNGVDIFCRGACWTPLDAVSLHAPRAAYDTAVAQLVDAGMNMLRIGGTMVYEDDALHDALDERGVLLWHDLMFANMDYPDDPSFVHAAVAETDQLLARLQARPSLAIVCGNSEGEQQAAMWGAERTRWSQPLFTDTLAARVRDRTDATYVPSSATSGAFPHAANAGPSSYYGVGAYQRPLEDARRAEVAFASECLAFANVPAQIAWKVHSPEWKQRGPRDLGAGWDFDDVRDFYVQLLDGVDPRALRYGDHERYLALGRVATAEVMARTFAEWRRARSTCGGGLVWFLRDLWPGAGWGIVDAGGRPKSGWYALRRTLAPIAIAISDEGVNGLHVHAWNDRPEPLAATLELVLYRNGEVVVGRGSRAVTIPAAGAIDLPAAALFEHFLDLGYAYRFGPATAHVVHAMLGAHADAFHFPAGYPAREVDVGLVARATGTTLAVSARRFARAVTIDVPGYVPSDDGFHLAPGQSRTIELAGSGPIRGHVGALNAEATAKIEVV